MYTPPMFKPDRAASLAFAEARGFGTVCAWDGSKPVASSLPFYLDYADDGTPLAAFHVARHNALAGLADGTSSWLMAVNGADAYVSPDWYASPDQVPTWLYQAVHLTGTVRKQSDDELGRHLDALSAKFENWLAPKPPWLSSKMTAGRLDAMKKAIVGLVMTVEAVEGSFKLNQHKSDADSCRHRRPRWPAQNDAAAQISGERNASGCVRHCSRARPHHWMLRRRQKERCDEHEEEDRHSRRVRLHRCRRGAPAGAASQCRDHGAYRQHPCRQGDGRGVSAFLHAGPAEDWWNGKRSTGASSTRVFCGLPHGTTQEIIAAVLAANPAIKILDMSRRFPAARHEHLRAMVRPRAPRAEAAGRSRLRPHRILPSRRSPRRGRSPVPAAIRPRRCWRWCRSRRPN